MGKPDYPEPPSPKDTAVASNSTNLSTAVANAWLGNVNQETPYGDLNFDQTGTYTGFDPYTKKYFDVPTFTASQTYTPEGQAILDETLGTQYNLAAMGNEQSGFLRDYLNKPVDLSRENIEKYAQNYFMDDFDRDYDRRLEGLQTNLANQGLQVGTEGYTRAMDDFMAQQDRGRDNLYGNMYGLAQQSIMAQRNQPLNEIAAMMSGSQVQNPNFVNTPMPSMPTTDVGGLINQNYNQRLAAAQGEARAQSDLFGGLFGAGGSILGGFIG